MAELSIALEITPPLQLRPAVLLRRAGLLDPHADLINVIQRPGRQASLEACFTLRAAGRSPVLHLVTHGREREAIAAELEAAAAGGLGRVLCLRGDHTAAQAARPLSVRAAVRLARSMLPAARIGVAYNQYAPDRAAALRTLLQKLAAGADFVQTQPVLEPAGAAFLASLRQEAPGVPLLPMVMPLLSAEAARRLATRLVLPLPPELLCSLDRGGSAAGWRLFSGTLGALDGTDGVAGLTVMTMELDPEPDAAARLRAAVAAFRARRCAVGPHAT